MQIQCFLLFVVAGVALSISRGGPGGFMEISEDESTLHPQTLKTVLNLNYKVDEIYNVTYAGFRKETKEINTNRDASKELMYKKLNKTVDEMTSKFENKMKELKSRGEDESKFDKCVNLCNSNFEKKIEKERKVAEECINDKTKKAKTKVNVARNEFTGETLKLSTTAGAIAQQLDECNRNGQRTCENWNERLKENVKQTEQSGRQQLGEVEDVDSENKSDLEECTNALNGGLEDLNAKFDTVLEKCAENHKSLCTDVVGQEEEEETNIESTTVNINLIYDEY